MTTNPRNIASAMENVGERRALPPDNNQEVNSTQFVVDSTDVGPENWLTSEIFALIWSDPEDRRQLVDQALYASDMDCVTPDMLEFWMAPSGARLEN